MGGSREPAWLRLARVWRGREPSAPRPPVLDHRPDFSRPVRQIVEQLDEIEAGALGIYAAHGLPTQPGQYARSPTNSRWKFIGAALSAEERWALALELGSTRGWRFCSLEDLGIEEGQPPTALSQASVMLSACRRLRQSLAARPNQAEDIQTALRLGADWKQAELMLARQTAGALRLSKIDAAAGASPVGAPKPRTAKVAPPKPVTGSESAASPKVRARTRAKH